MTTTKDPQPPKKTDTPVSKPKAKKGAGDLRSRLGLGQKPVKRSVSAKFLKEIQEDIAKPKEPEKPAPVAPRPVAGAFHDARTIVSDAPSSMAQPKPIEMGPPIGLEPLEDNSPKGSIPYKDKNVGKLIGMVGGIALIAVFLMGISYSIGKAFSYRVELNNRTYQAQQVKKVLESTKFKKLVDRVQAMKRAINAEFKRVSRLQRRSWFPNPRFIAACREFSRYRLIKLGQIVKGSKVWNQEVVGGVRDYITRVNTLLLYSKLIGAEKQAYLELMKKTVDNTGYGVKFKPNVDGSPAQGELVAVRSNIFKGKISEPKKDDKGNVIKTKKGIIETVEVEKLLVKVKALGARVGKPIETIQGAHLVLFNAHQLLSKSDKRLLTYYMERLTTLRNTARQIYFKTLKKEIDKEADKELKFTL